MRQTIVYLEDDAHIRKYTASFLEDDGYRVESFRSTTHADKYLECHANEVACIIVDLNMSDEWLDEYQIESDGCILTGWVWLQRFVFSREETKDIPCIIYSGFNKYLRQSLEAKGQLWKLDRNNLLCVDKGAGENAGYEGLLKALESVLGKGRRHKE